MVLSQASPRVCPRVPVLATLAAVAALVVPVAARAAAAPLSPDQTARVEAAVRREMQRAGVPGLSIAVARDGEIVLSRAYGSADVENDVAATPSTRFRTASVAKSLTATAVMKLAEQGKVDLDLPVQTYCPAFPVKPWPVTTRELLTHTSGVRHYQRRGESSGTTTYLSIVQALGAFAGDPLLFEPGTRFGYSTYGYMVLGCVVEGASGKGYDDAMAELVFTPARMERTGPDAHFPILPGRARGYELLAEDDWKGLPQEIQAQTKPGMLLNAALHDTSMKRAGGGLLSTAEDLARFGIAFQAGRLVTPATRDRMWTVQPTRDGAPIETPWGPLGLGWFVRKAGGHRELYSSGGQVGGRSSLYVYPDDGVVLAVMTNLTNADIVPLEREVLRVLLPDLPAEPETAPKPAAKSGG
jgi:CubicO group peptidase (beta-lactamase class C family)